MTEKFSVCQFFRNPSGSYEYAVRYVPAEEAIRKAMALAHSVGGRIGSTQRVIIVDSGDLIVWEWQCDKGVTFPPIENKVIEHE